MMGTNYFTSRRSIRSFSGRHVDEALVGSILSEAMKAPTCGNMQLYSVIITRDPEMKSKLAALHFSQPASTGCDLMLTVCADYNRFTRWCEINGADAGFCNFLSFTSAMTDAVIYAQQIVTIAEMEGLGTCYLGTVTYNADKISELLRLPDLVVPVACIALGWKDGDGEESERLPLDAILHREYYRNDSDERISDFFRDKENYPPNKGYVEENGKENLAQVFSEIRYPRGMNEEFSKTFLNLLKSKRFMD